MTLRREFLLIAGLSAGLVACGSSQDTGHTPLAQSLDAGHTPLPQLIYQGGALLAAPTVVTVTFPDDTLTSQVQPFGASLTATAWWNQVRSGYCATDGGTCVGDGPQGTSVALTTPHLASYTDSDQGGASSMQTWLAGEFANGTLPSPGPESNTIYVIYFPVGSLDDGMTPLTSVTFGGLTSCIDGGFDGYHNFMAVDGQQVPYAVVMECPPLMMSIPPIDLLQNTTITASHEVFEASSDPLPPSGFLLDLDDVNNAGWADIVGVEGADLCVDPFGLEQDETRDGAYTVQRIWSNARAAQGIDPCVPAPANEGYFNASPRESSFFVLDVGGSTTFEVDAWSSGPVADWTLFALDWSASTTTTYLSFSIAGGENIDDAGAQIQVHDGSRIQVTMTLLADPGSLVTGEADGSLASFAGDPGNPTAAHYWPFAVMSTADAADAGIMLAPDAGITLARVRAAASARLRGPAHVHRYHSYESSLLTSPAVLRSR
jgi:hypothetical protein